MQVKPVNNNVFAKQIVQEDKSTAGIIMAPGVVEKDKGDLFQVVEMADGIDAAFGLTVGSYFITTRYAGEELIMKEFKDNAHKLINVSDILAVVTL